MLAGEMQLASFHFRPVTERHSQRLEKEPWCFRRGPCWLVSTQLDRVHGFDALAPRATPRDQSTVHTADQQLNYLEASRVYEGRSTFRPDQGRKAGQCVVEEHGI
jgi:hypothetical protein